MKAIAKRIQAALDGRKSHGGALGLVALGIAGYLSGDLTLLEAGLVALGAGTGSAVRAAIKKAQRQLEEVKR